MSLFDKISNFLSGTSISAASAALPPQPPPKVTPKQTSLPPAYPTANPSPLARLLTNDRRLANTDILTFRGGATTSDTLRNLAVASPDLSAALSANLRLGIPEEYVLKAWNPDGSFNPEATRLAYQLLQRMDLVPDYTQGFNTVNSLLATSEALGRDLLLTGAMSMELVLDKSRLPTRFVPLASSQIIFYPDPATKSVVPTQLLGGVYTSLDQPTFLYVSLDQDLLTAYANSPFEAAIQPVLADSEFTNDMRRTLKRAAFPRLDVIIDDDMLLKSTPAEIVNDPEKLTAYRNNVRKVVEDVINGLQPEDALVHYSFVTVKYVDGGTGPVEQMLEGVQKVINSKVSTGAKTLPSVLGHGSGSQNVASSETLLAMKTADGMVRRKLNEMYSKAFTLAVRLFGLDVSVEFTYKAIDLRPTLELEAFRAQHQSRILEQLSFGMLTDEEACLDLTGSLPPAGMPPLSGTMFSQGISRGGGENPYSGTSSGGNGGGLGQAITPDAPKNKRGGNGK